VVSDEIPDRYGQTYLQALPRNPEWLYLYWEVSPEDNARVSCELGEEELAGARYAIRLLDVTGIAYDGTHALQRYDTDIDRDTNDWHLHVPRANRSYVAELGWLTAGGRFAMLARSNTVTMPQGGVSEETDAEWTTGSTDELIRISGKSIVRRPLSSEEAARTDISFGSSGSGL
jgi:hypothetical protein